MTERRSDDDGEPRRLGVRAFRGNMADVLRRTRNGQSFLITSRDEVLAELRPPAAPATSGRRPGVLRGRIRMAPDFDVLPADLLTAMEGEAE